MKVLFVCSTDDVQSVQKPLRSWSRVQFGISYISSILKSNGHQTQLVVLGSSQWKKSTNLLSATIEVFAPQLVCFTSVCSQYAFIEKMANLIKSQWPETYLVIGGPHATLSPDEAINGPFDSVCIGEGEFPALELCDQLEQKIEPHGIANLWIKSLKGEIEKNVTRNFIQNLDKLPFPDREMWKPWINAKLDDEISVLLGRGCPYNCTYCSNHALKKVANGSYVRFRSPENILQEVIYIHQNYQYRKIYFEVETIAVNKAWMIELCNLLKNFNYTINNAISYGCNFRISSQSMDEKLFIAMGQANFTRINIGLESGSERIRRDILKRNYSNSDFLEVVSLARKHGLKVFVFNMIGLPDESLNEHMDTVRLNREFQPDGHFTGIFYPYPGTELYNTCIQKGFLQGRLDIQRERMQPVIELPSFTKAQIQSAYTWFDYHVYKGHKPLTKLLLLVIMVKIRSNPITNLLFRKIVQLPVLRYLRARLSDN